jgi:endonuclease/exonuclease/phosphatase family metal-dependent hydrolase
VRRWRAAAHAERILYNTRTLELVRAGAMQYRAQMSAEVARTRPDFLAWAVLRVRATGTVFLFFTTHLEGRTTVKPQWQELIAKVNAIRGSRPVVVVGDFNTNKMSPLAATMLPAMRSAGYPDVLNQQYAENPVRDMRAQSRVNAWINSANHESRDVSTYSYANRRDKVGNSIDWIFASAGLPVLQYKLVLSFDPKTLQVQGVLPSDHNMVAATLGLP